MALLQPHPFEPLRLARPAQARTSDATELAGIGGAAPRVPQAELATPAEPVLSGGGNAAQVPAPVQLASAQPELPSSPPQSAEPQPAADASVDGAAANLAVWTSGAAPTQSAAAEPSTVSRPGFSDVVATVSALTDSRATSAPPQSRPSGASERSAAGDRTARAAASTARPQIPAASRSARQSSAARTAEATTRAATTRAASPRQAHPARVWVQLGVSANRAAFSYEISRMRRAAPELLRDKTPHVAPIGSNHRLLVGPFPNDNAARTFINGLRQKNIPSISWTSPAGTEVARFSGR